MIRLLLLEDDRLFSETLKDFLEDNGFEVVSVYDPYSAYEIAYESRFDIYLFDINLPFESGLETLKNLKNANDNTPAIFITSRDDKESLLKGFEIGCKDYIKKPFDFDELLVRIKANIDIKREILIGNFRLDKRAKKLYLDNKELDFNIKSVELLELLYENVNRVVTYEEIFYRLWPSGEPNRGSLRVYIAKLKKFFDIESIRGIGYILKL